MPFLSKAQQRWGNSPAGLRALGGKAKVAEWNASTPEQRLPEKVGAKRSLRNAARKAKHG